jgi:hypothetical protein
MLLYGGCDEVTNDHTFLATRTDTWELSVRPGGIEDSLVWRQLTTAGPVPIAMAIPAIAYDHIHDRLLVHGGNTGLQAGEIVWGLKFDGTPVDVQPSLEPAARLSLEVWPNPARSTALRIRYAVPRSGAIDLDVYDLAGRHVAGRHEAQQIAGSHTLVVDEIEHTPPGVYFVRLRFEGAHVTRRVLSLR